MLYFHVAREILKRPVATGANAITNALLNQSQFTPLRRERALRHYAPMGKLVNLRL
jgi:hypothetical protein